MFEVLMGVFFVLVAGAAYFDHSKKKRAAVERAKDVRAVATSFGMELADDDPIKTDRDLRGLPLFTDAYRNAVDIAGEEYEFGEISNVLRGTHRDQEIVLFEYRYREPGKNSPTRHQSVAAFRHTLPFFAMSPEKIGHQIAGLIGSQDIDFQFDPEFSAAYHLRGDDEKAIRNVFRRDLVQYFSRNSGWRVEAGGGWLIVYRFDALEETRNIGNFRDQALDIFELFESYEVPAGRERRWQKMRDTAKRKGEWVRNAPMILFGAAFAIVGALMMYFGYQLAYEISAPTRWPTVNGVITHSELASWEVATDDRYYAPKIAYEYTVAGRDYTSTSLTTRSLATDNFEEAQEVTERYPLGSSVAVYYDENDPANSMLEPRTDPSPYMLSIVGLIFVLGGLGRIQWTIRDSKREKP